MQPTYYHPPVPETWRDPAWPLVSVAIRTHNDAATLERALDGVLAQTRDFDLEIVIGDDASTDGTREIIEAYRRRFPETIVTIFHPRRNGGRPGRINLVTLLRACRGKYTAWLDADDYWPEPRKLQTQVAALEANPACSASIHDSRVVYLDGAGEEIKPPAGEEILGLDRPSGILEQHELMGNRAMNFHNSSYLFRTRIYGTEPERYFSSVAGDYHLFLLISERGPVCYFNECWSVYTKAPSGMSELPDYQGRPALLKQLDDLRYYPTRFPALTVGPGYGRFAARYYRQLVKLGLRERRWGDVIRYGLRTIFTDPALTIRTIKRYFGA